MTISAISSSGASFASTFQKDRQAFNQLANALQSGDLTAAQNAYNTLASSPMAQGNSPFAQAIRQIGQDLQSGDALADAQKVLSSLQQARAHHHHHRGGGEVSGSSNSSSSDGTNPADPDGTEGTGTMTQVSASNADNKIDIKA